MLTLMPAVSSWMTGIPAGVAGTFTIRLGRSIADHSRVASAAVAAESWPAPGRPLHAHGRIPVILATLGCFGDCDGSGSARFDAADGEARVVRSADRPGPQ